MASKRGKRGNSDRFGGFPGGAAVKNPPANTGDARDVGLIPGSGRSPGECNDNPLQYSYQENSMDRGTWGATFHGVTKSCTWLSNWTKTIVTTDLCLSHGKWTSGPPVSLRSLSASGENSVHELIRKLDTKVCYCSRSLLKLSVKTSLSICACSPFSLGIRHSRFLF